MEFSFTKFRLPTISFFRRKDSESMYKFDEKLLDSVKSYEYDEEKVISSRKEMRADVLKLQRLLAKSSGMSNRESISDLEGKSMKDIRAYEADARRQVIDTKNMIHYLQKIIDNEHYEMVYDIRSPMVVFEQFLSAVKEMVKRLNLDKDTAKEIKNVTEEIEKKYISLLEDIIKFAENESRLLESAGFADSTRFAGSSDIPVIEQIKVRNRLKMQINGKNSWIKLKVKELLSLIINAITSKGKDINKAQFTKSLREFERDFNGMIEFCNQRVLLAEQIVTEAIVLQKKKIKELDDLRKDLNTFYEEFIAQQESIKVNAKTNYPSDQAGKRKIEFTVLQEEVETAMKKLDRRFAKILQNEENKQLKIVKKEFLTPKRTVRVIKITEEKLKRWVNVAVVATLLVTTVAAGISSASNMTLTNTSNKSKVITHKTSTEARPLTINFSEYGMNAVRGAPYFNKEGVSVIKDKNTYLIKFFEKDVTINLLENNALFKLKEKMYSRSLAGYDRMKKENFSIKSLSENSYVKVVLDKSNKNVMIYARDVIIIDGPSEIACTGSSIGLSSVQGIGLDFSGVDLRKYIFLVDENGAALDEVALIDQQNIADIPTRVTNRNPVISPTDMYKAMQSFIGRGIYWGPTGISDADNINFVCNCLLRSGYQTVFGERFLHDMLRYFNDDYMSLRRNIDLEKYFKHKGAFITIKTTKFSQLSNYLKDKGITVLPGMGIQLRHDGNTHSLVIGKVTNGKIETIITGIASQEPGQRFLGEGSVEEIDFATYLEGRGYYDVVGLVNPYELNF